MQGLRSTFALFNHCPHFPFFMMHFIDSMPGCSIGGIGSVDQWIPKYASHVYKVTVAVDVLGNIIWICPLAPWTSADALFWDGYGPSRTRGYFFDFEVGGHDGAYEGRIHVIVPFIGRKNGTLTARQQSYNDVHGWYRARIEQLFARFWHWGLVKNIWRGGPNELHQSVRILLQFTQFCISRHVRHPPYRPWAHVPPHAWTDQIAPFKLKSPHRCFLSVYFFSVSLLRQCTSPCGVCSATSGRHTPPTTSTSHNGDTDPDFYTIESFMATPCAYIHQSTVLLSKEPHLLEQHAAHIAGKGVAVTLRA